jgi:hypothetical protein
LHCNTVESGGNWIGVGVVAQGTEGLSLVGVVLSPRLPALAAVDGFGSEADVSFWVSKSIQAAARGKATIVVLEEADGVTTVTKDGGVAPRLVLDDVESLFDIFRTKIAGD